MANKFSKVEEKDLVGLVVIGKSRNSSGRERIWAGAICTGLVLLDENQDRLIQVTDPTVRTKNKNRLVRLSTFSGLVGPASFSNFKAEAPQAPKPEATVNGRSFKIAIRVNGKNTYHVDQFSDWSAANVCAQAMAVELKGEVSGIYCK
jgi:hypothetical protein